jgi:hypothetical protein
MCPCHSHGTYKHLNYHYNQGAPPPDLCTCPTLLKTRANRHVFSDIVFQFSIVGAAANFVF